MRVALVLLLTASLHAQPAGPFARVPVDGLMAFSVAPHGMLVAWSEIQPGRGWAAIHVGVVDHDLNWISPVRTLTTIHDDLHPTSPAITTDGERFFVAWIDRRGSSWLPTRVSGTLVDASGEQVSPTFDLGDTSANAPAIVWDGLVFRSFAGYSYTITPHGAIERTTSGPVADRLLFATPDANGWVDWRATPGVLHCGFGGCFRSQAVYTIDWAMLSARGVRIGGAEELGYNAGRPAVVAHDDDLLVIWSDLNGLKAVPTVDGKLREPFRAVTPTVTEVVAAESLVVIGSNGDIYGVPIIDGVRFGKTFPIVTTKHTSETSPRVYLVGPNRYLVTWVVDRDRASMHVTGRFLTIE